MVRTKSPAGAGGQVKAGVRFNCFAVCRLAGFAAQGVQLGGGGLQQAAIAVLGQHAGQGQAVLPAILHGGVGVIGIRHAHPAKLDAAAIRGGKALGRVIVKAIVQGVEFAQCAIGAPVTLQGKVTAAVHVLAGNAWGDTAKNHWPSSSNRSGHSHM